MLPQHGGEEVRGALVCCWVKESPQLGRGAGAGGECGELGGGTVRGRGRGGVGDVEMATSTIALGLGSFLLHIVDRKRLRV